MPKIKIKGMSCQHCVQAVTQELNKIDGVTDVKVDLEKGEAIYKTNKEISIDIIKKSILNSGFDIE